MFALVPNVIVGQDSSEVDRTLLAEVMAGADTFSEREGDPPIFRAYRIDPQGGERTLVGYVFLTSDLPPEPYGYSGTIEALVGMDLEGSITGIKVMRYRETLRRFRGDFLSARGFQEQFTGKHISEPFMVGRDVAGITRATITVNAMSRGIRNSARRVAEAYLRDEDPVLLAGRSTVGAGNAVAELAQMSWPQMISIGLVTEMVIGTEDETGLELSFAYVGDEAIGSIVLGASSYAWALDQARRSPEDHHLMLLGIDGSMLNWFRPEAFAVIQGAEVFSLSPDDVIVLGEPLEGKVGGQVEYVGIMLISREVDITQPFTIRFDVGLGMEPFSQEYSLPAGVLALVRERSAPSPTQPAATAAQAAPNPEDEPVVEPVDPAPALATTAQRASGAESVPLEELATPQSSPGGEDPLGLSFSLLEDETVLARMFTGVRWYRVGVLLSLFGLVMYAFFRKSTGVRWVALGTVLVYMGFVDGSFLSVSHLTSGLILGPAVYLENITVLLVVGFTVVTTLLWGRIFCGFMCPFGALQDFLEAAVPRRFQFKMPQKIHERALYIKYGILALILGLALVWTEGSVMQYFEPFGTVFYLSPSLLLWAIAIGTLVVSAIVPRFYCRYACPLGAALGLASLLSPFRIGRVEQCDVCKVCEQSCPTGAIEGPSIDFKECVRCNICEIKLLARAGTCGHNMDEIRPRLVQLNTRTVAGVSLGSP
jgi:polyferredoxin